MKSCKNYLIKISVLMVILTYVQAINAQQKPNDSDEPIQMYKYQPKYSEELRKKAEKGDAKSQYDLGVCYKQGIYIEKDLKLSGVWILKSAKKGYADAMYLVSDYEYSKKAGLGFSREDCKKWEEKALKSFKKTAPKGDLNAVSHLAYYYGAYPIHYEEAKKWMQILVDSGDFDAMCDVAFYLLNGYQGYEKDSLKAAKLLTTAAENGYIYKWREAASIYAKCNQQEEAISCLRKGTEVGETDCMYRLAFLYKNGIGVIKNREKAIQLAEMAIVSDYTWAIELLGDIYADDYNGQPDYQKAFAQYQKAAEQIPSSSALYKMAKMYNEGKGVMQDKQKATELFKQLSNKFGSSYYSSEKFFCIGEMYYYGYGVKQDYTTAFYQLKKAAEDKERPSASAMRLLAACYRYGLGTTKDEKMAEYWTNNAITNNNQELISILSKEN